MSKYRNALPQLSGDFYMTDGGIETTLIFHEGRELPCFAAFLLLETPEGEEVLKKYFRTYAELANRFQTGLILETATWRASPAWGEKLNYTKEALTEVNHKAVQLLRGIRDEYETPRTPLVISGCVGPRGDGYIPDAAMSGEEAANYHRTQIEALAATDADLVTAITMNYAEEALGIALAARDVDLPVVISFTVETDGRLPTGQPLGEAIQQVDHATSGYPAYYMLNCAHPSHFEQTLRGNDPCLKRLRGLRANASRMSHAELDQATELDAGDPCTLGQEYAELLGHLEHLNVLGGCCGTDHRHIEQIAVSCLPRFRSKA
ncbi:MAG: homocysteine S-methyltransferase family protein [Planctomycetaceae bacterium]|nr:homocysteine S-methyltransferase family protein [Planctomycetaceae bacterium]